MTPVVVVVAIGVVCVCVVEAEPAWPCDGTISVKWGASFRSPPSAFPCYHTANNRITTAAKSNDYQRRARSGALVAAFLLCVEPFHALHSIMAAGNAMCHELRCVTMRPQGE